jgi:hypothetical protein
MQEKSINEFTLDNETIMSDLHSNQAFNNLEVNANMENMEN